MGENKQYEDVCRPQFQTIIHKLEKIDEKLFQGNGTPSLMERVARIEESRKAPMPTISGRPNATKFELGPLKISTNNAEVANMLLKIIIVLGLIYVGANVLNIKRGLAQNPDVALYTD